MQTTSLEVKVLQDELTILKPALEIAAADAEVMIAQIAKDTVIITKNHLPYLKRKL